MRSALILFVAAFSFYLLTMRGFTTGEGWEHFQLARHLLKTGTLGTDVSLWPNQEPGPDGHFYNVHSFGNTLLMLPFAGTLELAARFVPRLSGFDHMMLSVFSCFVIAAIISLLFLLLRALDVAPRRSFWISAGTAAATQFWPYTRESFDGLAFALFLLAGLVFLAGWIRRKDLRLIIGASAFLGFAIITRPPGVLWLPAFCLPVLLAEMPVRDRLKILGLAALTLLPFAFWEFFYNQLRTGNPLLPPIARHDHFPSARTPYPTIFAALLVSPGCGLFVFNPALLISTFGLRRFFRTHRAFALGALLGVIGHFIVYGGTGPGWQTTSSWGPRYLIMILPILIVPAAFITAESWRKFRPFFFPLIAASVALQLLAVVVDHTNLIYFHAKEPANEYVWSWNDTEIAQSARELPHVISRWTGAEPARDWPYIQGPRQLSANYGSLWFVFAGAFGLSSWARGLIMLGLLGMLGYCLSLLRRDLFARTSPKH